MNIVLVSIGDRISLPLAAPTLYSYCVHKGINHNIVSKVFYGSTPNEDIFEEVKNFDIVAFSGHSWSINKIKNVCKLFDNKVLTVIGGPYVTFLKDEIIKNDGIDIIVKGEGEETFSKILSGEKLKNIQNIIYKDDNEIIENKEDYHFDITKQNYPLLLEDKFPTIVYETSRGCPFRCSFCCWDISKREYRFYSLSKVEKDLTHIFKMENIYDLFFADSDLFLNKERGIHLLHIADSLNKERVSKGLHKIALSFSTNPQFLNDEIIDVLNEPRKYYKVGCGLQSIHKSVNKLINRSFFNLQTYTSNMKKLAKIKNNLVVELIYGLPGDSLDGFKDSLSYVEKEIESGFINCYIFVNVPGSYFWDNYEKYGLVFKKEPPHHLRYSTTFSEADIKKAIDISLRIQKRIST